MPPSDPRPPRLLDVRPMMARGEEPRAKVLAALSKLGPGESLAIVTPFLPSPLVERMQADGFEVRPEPRGDGSWQTLFRRVAPRE